MGRLYVEAADAPEALEALAKYAAEAMEINDEIVIVISRKTLSHHGGTGHETYEGVMAELLLPKEEVARGDSRWAWLEVD
jgi:hypothetical protein